MFDPAQLVDVDVEDTWPREARCLLDDAAPTLDAYDDAVRAHLDNGGGSTGFPSCPARQNLVECLDDIFSDRWLVGYHCTRLTTIETTHVLGAGLSPLSADFVTARLNAAVASGDIARQLADELLVNNYVDNTSGTRLGQICVVFSRTALRSETGLRGVLGYWGGEALYAAQSKKTRRALASIGMASIVELAVPVQSLRYSPIGSSILDHHRAVLAGDVEQQFFESTIMQPLPPEWVLRIYDENDVVFERLTGRSSWFKPDGTL